MSSYLVRGDSYRAEADRRGGNTHTDTSMLTDTIVDPEHTSSYLCMHVKTHTHTPLPSSQMAS